MLQKKLKKHISYDDGAFESLRFIFGILLVSLQHCSECSFSKGSKLLPVNMYTAIYILNTKIIPHDERIFTQSKVC